MKNPEVAKRIDELEIPKGKGHGFLQAYGAGLDLIANLAEAGHTSAIRLYVHLVKIMDRNSGAAMTDISSIIADTGLSRSAVYRAIEILKKTGHLRNRIKKVYEINPEGFWGGYVRGKKNALFMSDEVALTKGVRFRLNPGSQKAESFTIPATFEPVKESKEPQRETLASDTDVASAGENNA
ncbi:replication/maintenance protein RepL [Serratia sp. 1D1416]|uniref:replication/maintenance protein RepL n=1 Tax=Serratia sp. 1D1416 TaxID=2447890 RepID=UPI001013CB14|nr:replication/maintenance protein RepL [Serratia sp. 1D1416]